MRKTNLFVLCCLVSMAALSQRQFEPGPVSAADLQLKSCAFDAEATAMILFDIEESDIVNDYYTQKCAPNGKCG